MVNTSRPIQLSHFAFLLLILVSSACNADDVPGPPNRTALDATPETATPGLAAGVKSKSDEKPAATSREENQRLANEVAKTFLNEGIRGDITIDVKNGVVVLTGTVADSKIKGKVNEAVSKLQGIARIENRIEIVAPTKGSAKASSQDNPIAAPPVALPKGELNPMAPAEQTAQWKSLIRFEINGDVGRIMDTTFDYPKAVVQLEAEFDKCLDEERFKDGEKVVDEIIGLLRVKHTGSEIMLGEYPAKCTPHVLLKAWDEESTLCRRAADGEFGGGPSRRRSLAIARLKQVRDMAVTLCEWANVRL